MNKNKKKEANEPAKQNKNNKKKVQQQLDWESIKNNGNGYIITIAAKPNSKQTKVTQINSQFIGVSISAPPRQGEANQQLVRYIAQVFGAKKNQVYVDKGGKSRNKQIIIQQCQLSIQQVIETLKCQI